MSKLFFFGVLYVCINVNANSLDQLLKQQSVTSITPVEFNGLDVWASDSNPAEEASRICSMLGYTRLVSASTKSPSKVLKQGDKVATVRGPRDLKALNVFWFEVMTLDTFSSYPGAKIFDSISCAR